MTLSDFIGDAKVAIDERGLTGARVIAEDALHGALGRFGLLWNYGDDFWEGDWDLMVVLDACRADALAAVADEYDYIGDVGRVDSPASHSHEWLGKMFLEREPGVGPLLEAAWRQSLDPDDLDTYRDCFRPRDMSDTAYVTWNQFSRMLDPGAFGVFDEVWQYAWDDERDLVTPRAMTDRTIATVREHDPERTIAHYMQPHAPFLKDIDDGLVNTNRSPWGQLHHGIRSRENLWEAYLDNLRWVLDDLELLLENVDAESVVITSDHGNAMGAWGCYGHRPYVPVRGVKEVPWVETTATDEATYTPELERADGDVNEDELEGRLEALGYA